jgi:AcrR family transcriptional regulator
LFDMATASQDLGTRARLLRAAGELFAEKGFRGATLRDIAERAGANLAAANYHFGSKQDLYLEVVREHFERMERRLAASGATPDSEALERLSREGLVALLRARIAAVLESLLEEGGIHGTLMQRELCDPSDALPLIVERYIEPQRRLMETMVAHIAPSLPPAQVEWCARSIFGQTFFYLTHRSALLLLFKRAAYAPGFTREIAAHVTEFSLGALDRLSHRRARTGRRPRARRAARR